jgi:hypothetical protein
MRPRAGAGFSRSGVPSDRRAGHRRRVHGPTAETRPAELPERPGSNPVPAPELCHNSP